ncbi:hypothetical protein [Hydrogenibacillus sp. N12]|uniref:hypothetical protein n=1 Tax=Hydrogenibacillus sp. N12 TaxID=2866627 RepID=UPI001C7D7ECD|nr:hypothetical protein [Hydrogenibacillus sp. N12]QZA32053.1 hypothetical protein K2M58_06775 [Hydrogenibacillus sp. N12]
MSGDREYFYIGDRTERTRGIQDISGVWKFLIKYGVLSASHFEVRFPDDPELSEGKEEFLRLTNISVEPWSGMKGAIAVKGEMTPEARALFLRMIDGEDIRLWDYVLFRDGKKILSVSDSIDRIVTEHFAKEFMEMLFRRWFEAIPEPEIKAEKWETGELEELREAINKALFELEKDDATHG